MRGIRTILLYWSWKSIVQVSSDKVDLDIQRGCGYILNLLDSFTRYFGGVWVGRSSVVVLLWGFYLRAIILGELYYHIL